MGLADFHGRATVDFRHPEAFARCDECGEWWNRNRLYPQRDWSGNRIIDKGTRVCRRCLDTPQPQLRTPPTIADPQAVPGARPSYPVQALNQLGFLLFAIQPALSPGDFNSGQTVADAGSIAQAKADVLATVAAMSGFTFPSPLSDESVTINAQVTVQQLVPTNAQRDFILIYNPGDTPFAVSTGTAGFVGRSSVVIGRGAALLWQTTPQMGIAYQGAMTVIGYRAGQDVWLWEHPGTVAPGDFSDSGDFSDASDFTDM